MAGGFGMMVGFALINWDEFSDFRKVIACVGCGVIAAVAFAPRD